MLGREDRSKGGSIVAGSVRNEVRDLVIGISRGGSERLRDRELQRGMIDGCKDAALDLRVVQARL